MTMKEASGTKRSSIRDFHQARWNEPIIFELNQPGEVGIEVVQSGEAEEPGSSLWEDTALSSILRQDPPALPELGQMQILKHYLRLSQETLGADFNVDVGQGTCTVKYSPKVNEELVRSHKVAGVHPLQEAETIQGTLTILHKTDLIFREISGMDGFCFQPRSGTHAILAMASIVRAYHEDQGNPERNEVITTMFSHPSDAAAAHTLGFKIISLPQDPSTGLPRIEDLENALSDRTAALFITNPEDTGIFNPDIVNFTELTQNSGGLCCYDQANANGLLGITRAREAGFDMCFFNLHKTFSIPHACGGPASGALGVVDKLVPYFPIPHVVERDGGFTLEEDFPKSIGKIGSYLGVVPAVIRAYAWIMSLGAEGLRQVSQTAVLNNNYLLHHIRQMKGMDIPYSKDGFRIEQVRYSWQKLFEDTGISTEDIVNRMCDHGMHMWSSHHPFIVPNPMTLEPTESYSIAELDEYIQALESIVEEAYNNPEIVKTAPHKSCIHQVDHSWLDDPRKWAITWRAYVKKRDSGAYLESSVSIN